MYGPHMVGIWEMKYGRSDTTATVIEGMTVYSYYYYKRSDAGDKSFFVDRHYFPKISDYSLLRSILIQTAERMTTLRLTRMRAFSNCEPARELLS
jgi:hypothetical protein